jgi:hypothetical protein
MKSVSKKAGAVQFTSGYFFCRGMAWEFPSSRVDP